MMCGMNAKTILPNRARKEASSINPNLHKTLPYGRGSDKRSGRDCDGDCSGLSSCKLRKFVRTNLIELPAFGLGDGLE